VVEVPAGQLLAELVTSLYGPTDLGEQLRAAAGQPPGRAREHADRARILGAANVLERGGGGQIGEAVVVEVPGRQRKPEDI
jgi:hypothetical protein